MKTPERITGVEFGRQLLVADQVICGRCHGEIQHAWVSLSLHDLRFAICSGYGDVLPARIPWCPKCEAPPAVAGCVHIDMVPVLRARSGENSEVKQ